MSISPSPVRRVRVAYSRPWSSNVMPIGSAIIGNLVFYSNYGRKTTAAVGAASGKLIWSTNRGAFNPVISDGRRLYLNGYSSLFMLTTRRQARLDNKRRVQYRLAEQARSRARGSFINRAAW